MKTLILLAALAGSPPAEQFDLVCSGEQRFDLLEPYAPYAGRLRVDLEAKRWCIGECKTINAIAEVQPGSITFNTASAEEHARGIRRLTTVNRETGEFTQFIRERRQGDFVIDVKAQCAPAAFSGFPELPTRF